MYNKLLRRKNNTKKLYYSIKQPRLNVANSLKFLRLTLKSLEVTLGLPKHSSGCPRAQSNRADVTDVFKANDPALDRFGSRARTRLLCRANVTSSSTPVQKQCFCRLGSPGLMLL